MRNYNIVWGEINNVVIFRPLEEGGKIFRLTKENKVTYVLTTGDVKISAPLAGCLEYVSEFLTKEDLVALAEVLYYWGLITEGK